MYFNDSKENTNIDNEFNSKEKFDFSKYKKIIIIAGAVLLLLIIIILIAVLAKGKKNYFVTLEGDENITIYKGAVYNEPGYSGFDNKKNDLTSEVTVKDNLDTESTGTYTIIYSLHDKSATRTINVIERPDVITIIRLTGDKNMTLKVGDTFTDPGYKAVDAIDGDLTDKVKKTGNVDTATKGTYRIVYSVVNSKGITTTEVRTIIVE